MSLSSRVFGIILFAAGFLAAVAGGLHAGRGGNKVEIRPSEIKKGSDFAPHQQRVSERDSADYRRPTGILAQARHAPVRIDLNSLRRRRLDMYANRIFTDALAGHALGVSPVPIPIVDEPLPSERSRSLRTVVPVAILVVTLGCFLIWWRRQMKHAAGPTAQLLQFRKRRHARARAGEVETHVKLTSHR